MELEPWLATDWTNDGDCTWTITLRDGVKFSSGREMDGEAVKQCLEHLLKNHDRAPSDTKIVDLQAEGQTLIGYHQRAQSCPDELPGGTSRLHHRCGCLGF